MDAKTILTCLREELGLDSPIAALKQVRQKPAAIEEYRDKNNICYMIREALDENKTFYTIYENHVCTLGCTATGLDPLNTQLSTEQREASEELHVSAINVFPSKEIQAKAEREANRLFPKFAEEFKAIIIGPFESVADADVLIMLCTPEQVHLLTRAYCYATGSFIKGYAGMGACRILLPDAFLNKEPTYSVSDRSWRKALNIPADKLTLVTPPEKLIVMINNLSESQV